MNTYKEPDGQERHRSFDGELEAHLPKLKAKAIYLTRSNDLADDLLQRTCVRAMERSYQFEPGTRLDSWAATIMDSIRNSDLRKQQARQEQELADPDLVATADDLERRVFAKLMVSDLRRICTKLTKDDFNLLERIYVYDHYYRDVAEEMGVPIGTVLSRVSRARKMIKTTVGADEGGWW